MCMKYSEKGYADIILFLNPEKKSFREMPIRMHFAPALNWILVQYFDVTLRVVDNITGSLLLKSDKR